ncbi:SsgA family sporulation/cell division regulator [Streptomyces sp. NPDC058947]|uniref:SsgA family sporulation/cell division regulator n=1 Tax=Streptomyces sp. R02 TaxID=3238623 RepID=A0AB39LGN1_9ACTN
MPDALRRGRPVRSRAGSLRRPGHRRLRDLGGGAGPAGRGTRRPSGEGDFRVWPSYRRTGEPARLCFSLIGPRGHVTFEADLTDVRHWLDATYALVPSGTEHRMIDWDTLTVHWLDRT